MQTHSHLSFNGQCEEAFRYYEKHLGGKITRLALYEGTPAEQHVPPELRKKVIHAEIKIGDTTMMAADAPPGRYQTSHGIAVTLAVDTPADAERMFNALADGGTVQMPMEMTFFAVKFGMLRDRFGIPWMVICEKAT
ncbi:MAG: VOC family protein [Alphaproteobacteria bacterium]|nr:VOC family protein [Alphaproteobacteria bacterium]